jgi:hypothetical protein
MLGWNKSLLPLHAWGFEDSGFQDSEFRIPYGVWGILEYRTMRTGTAGAGVGRGRAGSWAGVTGSDMACRTLEFYVNSGVGHWMTWGSTWGSSVKSWQVTSDQTRKGTLAN